MYWNKWFIENIWLQTKINSRTNDSDLFLNWIKLLFEKIWLQKWFIHEQMIPICLWTGINDSFERFDSKQQFIQQQIISTTIFFSTWLQTTIYTQLHDSNQFCVLAHTTHWKDPASNNESFVYKCFNWFYGLDETIYWKVLSPGNN